MAERGPRLGVEKLGDYISFMITFFAPSDVAAATFRLAP
jgi:hypothetical protein